MHPPKVSLLPALVALLEEQSVSVAAQRLHVTQPAMSRTLQRLRGVVGDDLLVKLGRGLRRTLRGDALLEPARLALLQASAVLARATPFDAATSTGAVTVALGDDLQAMVGNAILLRLRARAPGLDVRLRLLGLHSVDEARRGEIDLAISPNVPEAINALGDFVMKPLYRRRFVTVSRRRRRLPLAAFCGADHVLVSPQGGDTGFVDESLAAVGHKRRVAVTVQSFGSAVQVLQRSDTLISTLPDDVVRVLAPRLFAQPCPVTTPEFDMCLVWHPRQTNDLRQKFLRDVVRAAVTDIVGLRPSARSGPRGGGGGRRR